MTDRKTLTRRLRGAGYKSVIVDGQPGWVPAEYAAIVEEWVGMFHEDVARFADAPAKPRGRPKKT